MKWVNIVEGLAPSEMKEETSKAQPLNKGDGSTPGQACILSGKHSGWVTLRREQWGQLSNHRKNQAMGKEGEADHISQAQLLE
jgi:hypothetical protein